MSNLKVYAKTIEDEALEQINTLLSQDAFKDCKVRIMPDVHAGKGCVIGFTADLGNKVIPNIVGVDIGCILGTGKGNEDWNCSAPHGAGRIMSRMKAKETLSMRDYSHSMDGIYTTSVSEETIDEAPMAYKPIDEIVECIGETVDILAILKPIYNFKASE